jgi:DNA-binding GntR family transcriptional regulator
MTIFIWRPQRQRTIATRIACWSSWGGRFSDSRRLAWTLPGRTGDLPQAAQVEHRAIYAAIAAGDAERARCEAHAHLRCAALRVGIVLSDDLISESAGDFA